MMLSTVFSVSGSNGTDILLDSSHYKTSKIPADSVQSLHTKKISEFLQIPQANSI